MRTKLKIMITQEEYEEAQEIVWDYEDQLKEQGKALDTNESNLPLHGVSKCKCEMKPLPNGDIELTLCQKCIDEGDVC